MDEEGNQLSCEGADVAVSGNQRCACHPQQSILLEKAAKLQAILDATVDGILTIDEKAIVQSFNKAAEIIFGYRADEVIGRNVNMLQPSPYREHHDEYVDRYLKTGVRKIIGIGREAQGRRKDGSTFPLYLAVSEVWVGNKRYFTGILRDLSQQKAAIEKIQSLARFPEENPYPILRVSKEGILLYANASSDCLLETWKCKEEQELPDPWRDIVLDTLHSGRSREVEVRCSSRIYALNLVPTPNAGDINVYGKDITERKRAEDELKAYRDHLEEMVAQRTRELEEAYKSMLQEEKLKTLGTISSEMAHEFRNPLMSIGGFARRLLQRMPDDRDVGIIVQESGRLEAILQRIESYLKPVELQPRECAVNEIITEAIDLISSELDREGVRVVLNLADSVPPAFVDPAVLIQVIVNVVHNAAKVLRQDGAVTIETSESGQNVHIVVRAPLRMSIKSPEHVFIPFGEQKGEISVPICFKLLRGMGGQLILMQEDDSVVFSASLLKALR